MEQRVVEVIDALGRHRPRDEKERRDRALVLRYLNWLDTPFDQTADPTHVTASAIVFNVAGDVLVHRHKRLGILLQPGGHVDGLEHPAAAAVRELREETGVAAKNGTFVHVDIHQGPRGHVHLDLRYRFYADDTTFTPLAGESTDVFFLPREHVKTAVDASLARAVAAARDAD